MSSGNREARDFLRKLGVGGKLAQTLVDRYGVHTEARLRQDPYSSLFSIPGVSFRHALPPFAPTQFTSQQIDIALTRHDHPA